MFFILERDGGKPWTRLGISFTDGEEAQGYAAQQNKNAKDTKNPKRYRVEAVLASDKMISEWRAREESKFTSGKYKPVPWAEEWWYARSSYSKIHFAHLSTKDKGMIAYTKDDMAGVQDKQTRVKPGRYLREYFCGVISDSDIAMWCARMGVADSDAELKFATTSEDIIRVYQDGPESCMSGKASVQAYAGPDLAVAYIERGGRITARAVVWPAKLRWNTPYGDYWRLEALLRERGYSSGSLQGARIARIVRAIRYLTLPYVDGISNCRDDLTHVTLGCGDIPLRDPLPLRRCGTCSRLYSRVCSCSTMACWYCGLTMKKEAGLDLDDHAVHVACAVKGNMRWAGCCSRYLPKEDQTCNCQNPTITELSKTKEVYGGRWTIKAMLFPAVLLLGLTTAAVAIGVTLT